MDVGLDLRALSAEELPYATLLHSLFLELGTQKQSYTQLAQRIAQHTGGLYGSPFSALHHDRQGFPGPDFSSEGNACLIRFNISLISMKIF